MKPARYVVTGGTGFIGSHIVAELATRGERVRTFDNGSSGQHAKAAVGDRYGGRVEFLHGDLRDYSAVVNALVGADVVFHQGGLASVPASIADPDASLEINVNGTHNVLMAARAAGVRRVVFASSSAVYGDSPKLPKHEQMLPTPLSPYAAHKLAAEYLCGVFTYVYGLETVALRYFNVFGPGQSPRSEYAPVIPRFITALLAGQRLEIYGDGEQTRDFTYIDDVVRANLLAAEAPAAVGRVLNIGCGHRVSLNEVSRTLSDLLGIVPDVAYRPGRQGDVHDSVADITRAREVLGYEPAVDLREGLARTIRAVRLANSAAAGRPDDPLEPAGRPTDGAATSNHPPREAVHGQG